MRGWRRNDLGLTKDQVLFVHAERLKMVASVRDRVLAGAAFDDAKRSMFDAERKAWKFLPAPVVEALTRCAWDVRLSDLGGTVRRGIIDRALSDRGKRPTPLKRLLFGYTGLAW